MSEDIELKEIELKDVKIDIKEEEEEEKPQKVYRSPNHPNRHHTFYPHNEIPQSTPKTKWHIGCLYLDKEFVNYFVQMIVLFTCLAISLYKVSTTSDNRDLWVSLLSSCLGIIAPSPKLKKCNRCKD